MRKESVNTFNDGLNYDLNPLSTPGSVLTDNINGTFLTFNGDELVLQNDAGNTRINPIKVTKHKGPGSGFTYLQGDIVSNISGDKHYIKISGDGNGDLTDTSKWKEIDLDVKLSNGFYPIGMKEYGGILYIISSKVLNEPIEVNINKTYNLFDVVSHDGFIKVCIKENPPIPVNFTDGEYWKKLANNFEDSKKLYNEIEIGSYPSIEVGDNIVITGAERPIIFSLYNADTGASKLYNIAEVHSETFKTGRYLSFILNDFENFDFLTKYDFGNDSYEDELYSLKLYLKLDSGIIDLTNDIWTQFIAYSSKIPQESRENHWIKDSNFKYFCPFNYKGKLVTSLEINSSKVSFNRTPSLEFVESDIDGYNIYSVSYSLFIENAPLEFKDKLFKVTSGNENITMSFDKASTNWNTFLTAQWNSYNHQDQTFYIRSNEDVIADLIFQPNILQYKTNIVKIEDLPEEIKNNIKLTFPVSLNRKYEDLYFEMTEEECTLNGKKYKVALLKNNSGYVYYDLGPIYEEPSSDPINNFIETRVGKPLALVLSNISDVGFIDKYEVIGSFIEDPTNTNIIGSVLWKENIIIQDKSYSLNDKLKLYGNISLKEHIEVLLKGTNIVHEDTNCYTTDISLNFGLPLRTLDGQSLQDGVLTLYQSGSAEFLPYTTEDGINFRVTVNRKENLIVRLYTDLFKPIEDTISKDNYAETPYNESVKVFYYGLVPVINSLQWEKNIKSISFLSEPYPNFYKKFFSDILINNEYNDGRFNYRLEGLLWNERNRPTGEWSTRVKIVSGRNYFYWEVYTFKTEEGYENTGFTTHYPVSEDLPESIMHFKLLLKNPSNIFGEEFPEGSIRNLDSTKHRRFRDINFGSVYFETATPVQIYAESGIPKVGEGRTSTTYTNRRDDPDRYVPDRQFRV